MVNYIDFRNFFTLTIFQVPEMLVMHRYNTEQLAATTEITNTKSSGGFRGGSRGPRPSLFCEKRNVFNLKLFYRKCKYPNLKETCKGKKRKTPSIVQSLRSGRPYNYLKQYRISIQSN